MRGRGETGIFGWGGGTHSTILPRLANTCGGLTCPPPLGIQQHLEKDAREHPGPLCHRVSSKTEAVEDHQGGSCELLL